MFTGIVEGVGALRSSDKRQGFTNWVVEFPEGALDSIVNCALSGLVTILVTVPMASTIPVNMSFHSS
ncbi:MAG: hypothetical protein EB156_01255, partial [Euryarchaeota archaeon]|nr:hypothetical protein [Euryarchaeota archaeon]NDF36405.1 hypothetical protein [Euryarchaeota archaeon]